MQRFCIVRPDNLGRCPQFVPACSFESLGPCISIKYSSELLENERQACLAEKRKREGCFWKPYISMHRRKSAQNRLLITAKSAQVKLSSVRRRDVTTKPVRFLCFFLSFLCEQQRGDKETNMEPDLVRYSKRRVRAKNGAKPKPITASRRMRRWLRFVSFPSGRTL